MERTRSALVQAFNRLALGRQRTIRVADIVAEAKVGRSTFYDHYSGAEDVYLEALSHPFAILADGITGKCEPAALAKLLGHFWQNRQRSRQTLSGSTGERAARLLARLIEERLEGEFIIPRRLVAVQLAQASLGPISAWAAGAASCSPDSLAAALSRGSQELASALRAG